MVLDSGASINMSSTLSLFASISYFNDVSPRNVILGDGTITLPILGFGSIDITINNYRIILDNILYIPNLNHNLFSIKEHIRFPQCSFYYADNKATLSYKNIDFISSIDQEITLVYYKILNQCNYTVMNLSNGIYNKLVNVSSNNKEVLNSGVSHSNQQQINENAAIFR